MEDKDESQTELPYGTVLALRGVVAVVGFALLATLTHGLFIGRITYSVGEVETFTVTTSTFFETLLVYLTFSPLALGMVIAGVAPHLYLRHGWLWKVLLGVAFAAYVIAEILRY